MKTIPQYVTKDGRRFYYSIESVSCCKCDQDIQDFVVVIIEWNKKKNSEVFEFCFDCAKTYEKKGDMQEKFIMSLTNKKPLNATLSLMSRPELATSKKDDSIFCNTLEFPRIDNKAKRSGHPDYTVLDDAAPAQIGASIDSDDEVEKDKLIESDDELDFLLDGFKDDTILIGDDEDEKKQLE